MFKLMEKFNLVTAKLQDFSTYKLMSIFAYLELFLSAFYLGRIYSVENLVLRYMGIFVSAFIVCTVILAVNISLILILCVECKFRKNFRDIERLKYTHWGFGIFGILTLLSLFWFVINMIFSLM